MTLPRSSPAALAVLLLLAGCPLPQSVPSVPAGSIPPPRIVDDVSAPRTTLSATLTTVPGIVLFDPNCAKPQSFTVTAMVADENYSEAVGYRWFANYDPTSQARWTPLSQGIIDPPTAEPFTRRTVPPQGIFPASFTPPVVVELVVSNGFDTCDPIAIATSSQPLPCRTPQTTPNSYEVQSHKWVFVPAPGCATAPTPTCIPCPP